MDSGESDFTSTFLAPNLGSESGIYAYCLYLTILIMGRTCNADPACYAYTMRLVQIVERRARMILRDINYEGTVRKSHAA